MPESPTQRLAYIDWLRGLACVLMFQTHCYDSWLGGSARNTSFLGWSWPSGNFPAPLFLLSGRFRVALVTGRLPQRRARESNRQIDNHPRRADLRLGLLFRAELRWDSAPRRGPTCCAWTFST